LILFAPIAADSAIFSIASYQQEPVRTVTFVLGSAAMSLGFALMIRGLMTSARYNGEADALTGALAIGNIQNPE